MSAEEIKKELLQLIESLSEKEIEEALAYLKKRQTDKPANDLLKKFDDITDKDDWVFQELAK